MKKLFSIITFFIIILLLLTFSIKGKSGDPVWYQTADTRDSLVGGPFESTNNTSRYVLTEAIAENQSFSFTLEQAKFAVPDVSGSNGKFFSLFSPGVSLLSLPFYYFGKLVGLPQLFSYFSVSLFAVLNVYLIYLIARKLGSGIYTALISGFLFLFGTNAYAYALSFTQHHMSTTIVLLGVLNALGKRTLLNNILLGALTGVGLLLDIPNIIFLAPIFVYILFKHFTLNNKEQKTRLSFNPNIVGIILGIIPFVLFLGFYNQTLTGSPTSIAQFVGRTEDPLLIDKTETVIVEDTKPNGIQLPFESRRLLNGFYILLISDERSWIYYSPVVLFGVGGFILLYKRKETKNVAVLCISTIGIIILTYAMFIDPWGGWSYGARYLIPAAGILAIGIAPLLDKYKRNYFFIPLFFTLAGFSIYINTLGAYTTSSIAPKVEAVNLETPIPYTYEYNFQLLEKQNLSSSLFYDLYFSKTFSSKDYIAIFSGVLITTLIIIYIFAWREKQRAYLTPLAKKFLVQSKTITIQQFKKLLKMFNHIQHSLKKKHKNL